MKKLIEVLLENNLKLSSVESLTGGLFASEIVSVTNASSVYLGSIVAYANNIKSDILKIDEKTIDKYGSISETVAQAMALSGQRIFKSDVCVAFSGNAGPSTIENKQVGQVYTCIVINDDIYNYCDNLSGNRNQIRKEITHLVKTRLIKLLQGKVIKNG